MKINTDLVLDCPMQENDSGANTIRGYLKALLLTLWEEDEGFSGKRPFGNSGWCSDIAFALVKAGLIDGSIYQEVINGEVEYENLEDADFTQMDVLIKAAIKALR